MFQLKGTVDLKWITHIRSKPVEHKGKGDVLKKAHAALFHTTNAYGNQCITKNRPNLKPYDSFVSRIKTLFTANLIHASAYSRHWAFSYNIHRN